ncbi:MAG: 3-isopropylmalate dehydratase small subunit [Propionibacteriaceae bacterium]
MDKFTRHTGTALPLRRSNVDTDQIIPAVYLKRVTKTGFEDGLFAAWRNDPEFILNKPEYAQASILVAGPDFGTGSSREHAVWALQNYGFKAVIGSRFGDIFRGNSGKAGLLIAVVDQPTVEAIQSAVEADPAVQVTIDLAERSITVGDQLGVTFEIDDYTRWRLSEGLDDIGLSLRHVDDIDAFEGRRQAFKPTTLPIKDTDPANMDTDPAPTSVAANH